MAEETHIHTEGSGGQNNGYGFLLGVVVLIVFVLFFMYYMLPMFRQYTSGPQINVPDKIDVNIEGMPEGN